MNDPGTVILIVVTTLIPVALWIHFIIRNRTSGVGRKAEREQRNTIVLGQQIADAQAKEEERLERTGGATESPLPEGGYERRDGEFGLLRPSPQAYDESLRKLCTEFARESSAEKRDAIRDAIPMMDCYTLMEFASRCAVFALRDQDPAILQSGLSAIAMIDVERTDFRDLLRALAFLCYSAERLEMDTAAALENAARLSASETAMILRSSIEPDSDSEALGKSWGFHEVKLDSGIGFVELDFESYEPQHDLVALGIDIAAAINRDPLYIADRLEIGTQLPPIWLRGGDDKMVAEILSAVSAGMKVSADPADREGRAADQMLVVFTAELDSPKSAQRLLEISQRIEGDDTVILGFAKDNVFSLIVSRSTVQGIKSVEKGDSLERFSEPINKALSELKEIGAP